MSNEDTKALQCDRCMGANTWKCVDCLNISSDMCDRLASNSNISLRWFCDSCEQAVMDPRGTVPPLQNEKLHNIISLVEKPMQRHETFENKLHDKCDVADAAKIEIRSVN